MDGSSLGFISVSKIEPYKALNISPLTLLHGNRSHKLTNRNGNAEEEPPVMALTINTTDIDAMFDAVNNHIIPKAGETVSAMPSLIIPLAFLVVLLMILFFVPDVLYSMLEVIKGAIHKGKK
jgi:hypothetical protein